MSFHPTMGTKYKRWYHDKPYHQGIRSQCQTQSRGSRPGNQIPRVAE
jgi:hypothetical protein